MWLQSCKLLLCIHLDDLVRSHSLFQVGNSKTNQNILHLQLCTHDLRDIIHGYLLHSLTFTAVKGIKKKDLVEVKSMNNPPPVVKLTLESICLLLGEQVSDWKSLRAVIVKDNFITNIVNMNTNDIRLVIVGSTCHLMVGFVLSWVYRDSSSESKTTTTSGNHIKFGIEHKHYEMYHV